MKRSYKSMLGVTLLEIMLVLAIAALVIVMSIRFYQQASTSGKVNAAMSQVQGIVAAVESWQTATSQPYSAITGNDTIANYLPGQSAVLTSPFGSAVTVTGAANGFTITYATAIPDTGSKPCTTLKNFLAQSGYVFDNCTTITITL